MPTVSTYLKMMDQFSSPLRRTINQVNTAIHSMERMRRLVEAPAELKVNVNASQITDKLNEVRTALAASGTAAIIDVSINADDIMSKISSIRSHITGALSSAAVDVSLSGSAAISEARQLKTEMETTFAGMDIRPTLNVDASQARSSLEQHLSSLPNVEVNVSLGTAQALSEAATLRADVLSRIGDLKAVISFEIDSASLTAEMEALRSRLASGGSATVIDVSVNADDIMTRMNAIRSHITSSLAGAAVDVSLNGSVAITEAGQLKGEIEAALAGIDIRPTITVDASQARAMLEQQLSNLPGVDVTIQADDIVSRIQAIRSQIESVLSGAAVEVTLDGGSAVSEARQLRTDIAASLANIDIRPSIHIDASEARTQLLQQLATLSPIDVLVNVDTSVAMQEIESLRSQAQSRIGTMESTVDFNVDTTALTAELETVRSRLASAGSATVIDISINADDIVSRINAIRSHITSALSGAAVEVTLSTGGVIAEANVLKSRIEAALSGIDIQPTVTVDASGLRSQLMHELSSIPHAEIKVKLDAGDALREATLLRTQILSRIGSIVASVELNVSAQLSGTLGTLDGTMARLISAIDRLIIAMRSGGGPGGGGGGGGGRFGALMGGAAALAAGVAAVVGAAALAGAGISGAVEQQQMQGSIQAQTGVSGEEAAGLVQSANNVYTSGWGQGLPEIANDIAKVQQNLQGLSQQATEAFVQSSYVVEKVSNGATNVEEISKVTKTLMANFDGLSESVALDMITTGFQQGGNFAGDFMDTINEYAVHFEGLGMSADQMFATLIEGSKQGAFNLDKVGDSVKESFIRMQDMSKTSAEGYKLLGLDANKMAADIASGGDKANQAFQATLLSLGAMKDPLQQNAAGVALFGTQWEDVKQDVITAMAAGQKGLGDFQGATAKAGEALEQNLAFQADKLKRSFVAAFAEAGKGAADGLMPVVEKLNQAFEAGKFEPFFNALRIGINVVTMLISGTADAFLWVVDTVRNNWPIISAILAGVAAAIVANIIMTLPPLSAMIAALWAAVPPLIAQAAAWLAINWPILLIGLAVAGLVYVMIEAGVTFRDVIGFIGGLFGFLYGVIHNRVALIWNILVSLGEFIGNLFIDPVYAGKKLIYDLAQAFGGQVVNMLRSAEDFAGGFMKTILSAINGILDGFNWLSAKIKDLTGIDMGQVALFDEQNVHAVSDAAQALLDQMVAPTSDADVLDWSSKKMEEKNLKEMWDSGKQAGFNLYDKTAGKLTDLTKAFGGGKKEQAAEAASMGASAPSMAPASELDKVGKVGEVGKINDTVDISSEDLKTMRELAEMKNIQNFVTLTPQLTFGDTHIKQDGRSVDAIIAEVADKLEQEIAISASSVLV
jgi:predicted amino acid-binding ACT domain protein